MNYLSSYQRLGLFFVFFVEYRKCWTFHDLADHRHQHFKRINNVNHKVHHYNSQMHFRFVDMMLVTSASVMSFLEIGQASEIMNTLEDNNFKLIYKINV